MVTKKEMFKAKVISAPTAADKWRGITTAIIADNIMKSKANLLDGWKRTWMVVCVSACIPSIF